MRRTSLVVALRLGMMFLLGLISIGTTWSQLPVRVQTPTNTKARSLLEKAQQHVKDRDFVKAIESLNQLNEKFPSFGEAFLLKGSLLKIMGDNRGALAAYREGRPEKLLWLPDFVRLSACLGDQGSSRPPQRAAR